MVAILGLSACGSRRPAGLERRQKPGEIVFSILSAENQRRWPALAAAAGRHVGRSA
jgi:hypothetical protein